MLSDVVNDQNLEQGSVESVECLRSGDRFSLEAAHYIYQKYGVEGLCPECCYENGMIDIIEYKELT